jgi:hypothetical protein
MSAALACVNELSLVVDIVEDLGIQMEIIDNDLSFLKAAKSLYSEQADVSRPGPDKINFSGLFFHKGPILAQKPQQAGQNTGHYTASELLEDFCEVATYRPVG